MTGRHLFDHYSISTREDGSLWELGRGSMGVTYRAEDVNLQRLVALKVINAECFKAPHQRERFIREARAAASLRHRNIASVHHLGIDAEHFFYAMEFVQGTTAQNLVERMGPMPAPMALCVASQVAAALGEAARHGLVHRDIKPANVMITAEPDEDHLPLVKVIDFGLVKAPSGSSTITTATGFVGTPQFTSPEQAMETSIDIRSDFYSLGCTLWFLLTGSPPFTGTLANVFAQHLHAEPPWEQLSVFTPSVRRLLRHLLRKDAAERPQTAAELRKEITRCMAAVDRRQAYFRRGTAYPGGPMEWSAPLPRERSLPWLLGAMALFALVGVTATWATLGRQKISPVPASGRVIDASVDDGDDVHPTEQQSANTPATPAKGVQVADASHQTISSPTPEARLASPTPAAAVAMASDPRLRQASAADSAWLARQAANAAARPAAHPSAPPVLAQTRPEPAASEGSPPPPVAEGPASAEISAGLEEMPLETNGSAPGTAVPEKFSRADIGARTADASPNTSVVASASSGSGLPHAPSTGVVPPKPLTVAAAAQPPVRMTASKDAQKSLSEPSGSAHVNTSIATAAPGSPRDTSTSGALTHSEAPVKVLPSVPAKRIANVPDPKNSGSKPGTASRASTAQAGGRAIPPAASSKEIAAQGPKSRRTVRRATLADESDDDGAPSSYDLPGYRHATFQQQPVEVSPFSPPLLVQRTSPDGFGPSREIVERRHVDRDHPERVYIHTYRIERVQHFDPDHPERDYVQTFRTDNDHPERDHPERIHLDRPHWDRDHDRDDSDSDHPVGTFFRHLLSGDEVR